MQNFPKRNAIIFFALSFVFAAELKAQALPKTIAESVEAGVNRSFDIKMRSNELERMKQEVDRDIAATNRESVKTFPEIKNDFEQIQVVNLDSLQKNIVKDKPDYKSINKAAAEIRKRAGRLKRNLFPQELAQPSQNVENTAVKSAPIDLSKSELKTLSIALDNSIYRFISNNIFQNINVFNLNDSFKAQTDLKQIIEICSLIETKSKN